MGQLKVLILACGTLGKRVGRLLVKNGVRVGGTSRSQTKLKNLVDLGIVPIHFDFHTPQLYKNLIESEWILLCPAPEKSDEVSYRDLYQNGLRKIQSFMEKNWSPKKILYTSSTSVFEGQSGKWVDESTPLTPTNPKQKILLETENSLLKSSLPVVVYRLGGLYGPGRNRLSSFRSGSVPTDWNESYLNLLHLDDAARSLLFLFDKAQANSLYMGVDHKPVRRREFYTWIATQLAIPINQESHPPDNSRQNHSNKRVSNKKLLSLGYKFLYPTYQEGYQQILQDEACKTLKEG